MQRHTAIGLVDMLAGKYVSFTELDLPNDDSIINAMYASLSTVAFYPPAEAFGSAYVDGAAVYDIDIPAAINECLAQGFKAE